MFVTWFGATLSGLSTTLIGATIIEICSKGLVSIAADLMTGASASVDRFSFPMAALLPPLLTVPQILVIGWALNAGEQKS